LYARHALLPDGWRDGVLLEWDAQGDLTSVREGAEAPAGAEHADYVLPGMVNLHSHAFQRAMAGLAEQAGDTPDSFWTWRELMYRFAGRITPEQIEAVASQLYVECLRHGYTASANSTTCSATRAARSTRIRPRPRCASPKRGAASGIGLTMLPVMYSYAGFGEQALKPQQRRFRTDPESVLRIVEALDSLRGPQLEVGAAPHSLRAVSGGQLRELVAGLPAGRPLHIHIAEQQLEVQQCLEATGSRPVDYLMRQVEVDARWCLVHATHLSDGEVGAAGGQRRLLPACARPPRPTSATACSR
jgi:formimidoylglutamate deiminase